MAATTAQVCRSPADDQQASTPTCCWDDYITELTDGTMGVRRRRRRRGRGEGERDYVTRHNYLATPTWSVRRCWCWCCKQTPVHKGARTSRWDKPPRTNTHTQCSSQQSPRSLCRGSYREGTGLHIRRY